MKEIDFVGHFNKEWECLLENLSQPMIVSESELKIFFKVQIHRTHSLTRAHPHTHTFLSVNAVTPVVVRHTGNEDRR